VAQEFDTLLGGDRDCKTCNGKNGKNGTGREHAELESVLIDFKGPVRERLAQWVDSPRVLALREDARGRLTRLLQRTAQWLGEGRISEVAVLRMADWIEPLLRRESYLALMLERPSVYERLLRLLGAAKWPARYLLQHPGVIDELAGGNLFDTRFDAAEFEAELQARRVALQRTGEDDDESLMNLLRRAHHAEQFRTLARDVEGVLTVEQVADDLSALADAVLRVTARWCWGRLKNRHREEPAIAIIGYGKLGGKELGYGSDLDIVFVYDDEDERAQEIYAAYVRKMINWMTVKTAEGDIYEIDTALRPNGNSGLLVTRFEAYADYQQQRGSNTAWTWEHQAMTRARFVMGWPSLAPRFDAVRHAVISAPRDAVSLKAEIVAMRERVRQGHLVKADHFDVKHSPGGMVDAEFAVQYLVLLHTAKHPELADNVGNIALLIRAEVAGLLPIGQGQAAANAYREMRRLQHRARLNEEPTQVDPASLTVEREALLAVWRHVMG
jgi:glutamate-ammonia-ligase adenylyltransferase